MQRTNKFYRQNERDVMERLGLKPTKNSGSGWVEKEDGVNESCLCQLKSTDAKSISVNQKDLRILEYNAQVAHKIPVFALQFLNTDEVWLMVRPEDLYTIKDIANGVEQKQKSHVNIDLSVDLEDGLCYNDNVQDKSKSIEGREKFYRKKAEEAEKRREQWREQESEWKRNLRKRALRRSKE